MTRGTAQSATAPSAASASGCFGGHAVEVTSLGEYKYVTHRVENAGTSQAHDERMVFVFQLRPVNP